MSDRQTTDAEGFTDELSDEAIDRDNPTLCVNPYCS